MKNNKCSRLTNRSCRRSPAWQCTARGNWAPWSHVSSPSCWPSSSSSNTGRASTLYTPSRYREPFHWDGRDSAHLCLKWSLSGIIHHFGNHERIYKRLIYLIYQQAESLRTPVGLPPAMGGPPLRGAHRPALGLLCQVRHCDVGNALGVPS